MVRTRHHRENARPLAKNHANLDRVAAFRQLPVPITQPLVGVERDAVNGLEPASWLAYVGVGGLVEGPCVARGHDDGIDGAVRPLGVYLAGAVDSF